MVEILLFACFYHRLPVEKTTKWPYFGHFASKWKNEGTLFPSTLKVKGNKVLLFFHFGLKRLRYRNLLVFFIICFNTLDEKKQNGHIWVILPQNEKIKALYILQFQKLQGTKCFHFFISSWNGQDIAIFLFLSSFASISMMKKQQNGHISVVLTRNEKIKALCFLQL